MKATARDTAAQIEKRIDFIPGLSFNIEQCKGANKGIQPRMARGGRPQSTPPKRAKARIWGKNMKFSVWFSMRAAHVEIGQHGADLACVRAAVVEKRESEVIMAAGWSATGGQLALLGEGRALGEHSMGHRESRRDQPQNGFFHKLLFFI
jgi:hypothetical protein